jgi:calcium/calmodulin-dependent protein kinase I
LINQKNFAAKCFAKSRVKKTNAFSEILRGEINILRRVDHPNAIQLLELFEDDNNIILIMELMKEGSLFDHVNVKNRATEIQIKNIMKDLLQFLKYFHKLGYIHRAIIPSNILIKDKENISIKVCDFGMACAIDSPDASSNYGTAGYVAPELLRGELGTEKVDIFSVGVLLHNLLIGKEPCKDSIFMKTVKTTTRYFFDSSNDIWKNVSDEAKEFIFWMTNDNPEERPTACKALRHPWFNTKKRNIDETLASINPERESIIDCSMVGNISETMINPMSPKFMRHLMDSNKCLKDGNEGKPKEKTLYSSVPTMTDSMANSIYNSITNSKYNL